MLFSDLSFDLSPLLQFVFTALVVALGLLQIIKATASRYLVVDARFEGDDGQADVTVDRRPVSSSGVQMSGGGGAALCFVCGDYGKKICTGCRAVRYCSPACQSKHWREDHKLKCRDLKFSDSLDSKSSPAGANLRRKASGQVDKFSTEVSLIPARGTCKVLQRAKKVLFPYDEFVKLFNWDNPGFPPCGLLNCGNSCFANVVLQCLACTRPLVAYLLEKGHSQKCNRNDWCFLCELESHVHRVNQSLHPFSPINILSRLPHIGGNLGYGKQEDAHEFMRFAIDTMQSVFLDEFGGESALDHATQQTTLIQHMFGGHLQSEVICTKCDNVSYCYENMMDLTVEIQGDAASLENCLDQFTKKEWLDGENMYKCDRCNAYVKAWKRLTVHQAPNILTVALKRFQSGRFGKLNKRVTFPETLDLRPYMSGSGDGTDLYRLYAVVVHVDMLNASFFGHYICYTQDFCGNWYRIDDCKVMKVELEEVLGQGAYMLLYSRLNVRQPRVKPLGPATEEKEQPTVEVTQEVCQGSRDSVQEYSNVQSGSSVTISRCPSSDFRLQSSEEQVDVDSVHPINVGSDPIRENLEDMELGNYQSIPLGPAGPDGACLSCQPHEAEENLSSELMHEESSSGLSNKQSSTAGSSAVESQEPSTSSAADCHHEEENYTSKQSKELPPPESQSSRSFCSNMLETVSSGVSNTGLQNVLETVEVANTGLDPSLVTDNSSVLITGTTSLGKAFQATENVLEVKSSLLLGDKANSNCKPKPLFRPGFLDRPVGRKSLSKDEKTQHEPAAVCTSQSNYNGFADHAHQNGSKSNGHDDVGLETVHGNSKGILVSEGPVTSSSAIDKLSRKIHWEESRELNGGTSMVGSACNTDCNGTSNVGSIHIRDVRLETLCESGKDISLDFRNDLNSDEELDKRSEFHSGKLEASCNGFADTIIFNQNESNICGKDEKSVKICENGNGVTLVPRLPHVALGPEVVQEEFDRAGTDPLKPKTDCGGYTDSFYSTGETEICSQGVAPGASWENGKDVHLNCKRPRQEDV